MTEMNSAGGLVILKTPKTIIWYDGVADWQLRRHTKWSEFHDSV